MDLLNMLMKVLTSSSSLSSLTGKTGASTDQITSLISSALPQLIKALTKNASTAAGAQSLATALTAHTNTNAISSQIADADEEDGAKIVNHILGSDASSVISSLAGSSGLNSSQVQTTLNNIAPALMSGLSAATGAAAKADSASGLDLSSVMSMLGGADLGDAASSASGLLGSLLGGGSDSSSSSGIGSLIGSLLGGKSDKDEKEDTSSVDGTALLGELMNLMKK